MKDNRQEKLSEIKGFQRLQYLVELQARLGSSKTIREARKQQGESNSCTAVNPII